MQRVAQNAANLAGTVRGSAWAAKHDLGSCSVSARALHHHRALRCLSGSHVLSGASSSPERARGAGARFASGRTSPPLDTRRRYARESGATTQSHDDLPPNMPILDDTPPSGVFPIKEDQLIELAKRVHAAENGAKDPDLLADNFRFEFPVVKLDKRSFLKALGTFKFDETFPDKREAAYHWRVDPYEPHRVWYTVRAKGTHRKTLNLGGMKFYPTNKEYRTAPQCMSLTFNSEGKATSLTGGYVMDGRVGNGGNLGGLFGVLKGVGLPVPGTPQFFLAQISIRLQDLINFFTLGIWNKLLKRE